MFAKLLSKLRVQHSESRGDAHPPVRMLRLWAPKREAWTTRHHGDQQRRYWTPRSNQLSS